MTNVEQNIRSQAANFLYTFMDDSEITQALAGRYRYIVTQKKYAQLRYLKATAVSSNHSMDELVGWIRDEMADVYSEQKNPTTGRYATATPRLILYHLAEGRPAGGKDWNLQSAGKIGELSLDQKQALYNTVNSEFNINWNTGDAMNKSTGGSLPSIKNYYNGSLFSKEYIAGENQQAFGLKYSDRLQKWSLDYVTNQNGSFNGTPSTDYASVNAAQKTLNVLQTVNAMLPQICNLVRSLRDFLKQDGDQQTNWSDIKIDQKTDGWYDASASSNASISPWLLAGIALGGIALTSKDLKPFKKRR